MAPTNAPRDPEILADHRDCDAGESKPMAPLAWEPPGGLRRRPVFRGQFKPRRPR